MRHPYRWEQMLPEEFLAEQARAPIVYWPCGSVEEHGLHSVMGVDPFSAYEVCLRAAAISGGIVHPPVWIAPAGIPGFSRAELRAGETYPYPPSLWVSRETCELVYTELLESMADVGFKLCMAVGGHYPSEHLLGELEKTHGGQIAGMRFWGGGNVQLLRAVFPEQVQQEPELFGHGMMWETANMRALNEDWVDLARVDRIRTSSFRSQLQRPPAEHLARVKEASAAFGNRYYETAGAHLARIAGELLASSRG